MGKAEQRPVGMSREGHAGQGWEHSQLLEKYTGQFKSVLRLERQVGGHA